MKIDGIYGDWKQDKSGVGLFLAAGAPFEAAVKRGRCFAVANQTGVTSQAGLSLTTPVLTLYNPLGSGTNGKIWFAGATFTVAFATAGAIWLAAGTDAGLAKVTGTRTTSHRNLLLSDKDCVLQPFTAATLPAAPVGIALLGAGLTGAITTLPYVATVGRWFDGAIVVTPGSNITIQTGVASGASGMFCEFVWEEEDA